MQSPLQTDRIVSAHEVLPPLHRQQEDPVPDRRAGLAAVWTSRGGSTFALPVVGMTGKLHTRSNEQDGSAASSDEGGMAAEKRVDGTLYLLPVQTRAPSVLCHW